MARAHNPAPSGFDSRPRYFTRPSKATAVTQGGHKVAQDPMPGVLDDILALAELLRPRWAEISGDIPGWHPRCEGEEGGSGSEGEGEGSDGGEGAGEEFDKDRALSTIRKQRESEKKLKAERDELREKLQQHERANESEKEKAEREKAEAIDRATKAEGNALRLEVALDKAPDGMSLGQVRKLAKRLSGSTKEELEADADELFADFTPAENGGGGGGGQRRPRENLRPGAAPSSEPEELDPDKLAAKVPRQF